MTEPPGRISLVLSDVDGTLLTGEKVLSERTRAAVRHLRSAGISFAMASARPPRGMRRVFEALEVDTPVAGFNGGMIVRPDLSVLVKKVLTLDVAVETVARMRKHGLDPWVFAGIDWLITDRAARHVDREVRTVGFEPTLTEDLHPALGEAVKIVGVSDDHDAVARCEAAIREALGNRAAASRSHPYYLDVTHRDANKGAVTEYLSRALAVPSEEIVTIGDGPNDVRMFEKSGFGIAMGNASEAIRRAADAVTASNDDEGFARAMDRYVLGD